MCRQSLWGTGIKPAVDGAAISQTNRWGLNPPKRLSLIGDLNSRCPDRSLNSARNMDILGCHAAFDMATRKHMDDLTQDLPLDATGYL